jgi:hypothetical protein
MSFRAAGARARRRLALTAPVVVLAAGFAAAPAASAAYGPGAEPASAAGNLLGDDRSTEPLLSADGRYVVFTTSAETLLGRPGLETERYSAGIVRKDTATGAIELVAPPQRQRRADRAPVGTGTPGGAAGISADGRYVLFQTSARLSPNDGSGITPDVYVRDMTQPVGGAAAYELVSARDGAAAGAEYADPAVGSVAGSVWSLSGDGRRAVFVTLGASDLPARSAPSTPRWQVWLRDLDARTTRLVSRDVGDGSLAGTPAEPPVAGQTTALPPVAAISADGGTLAWTAGEAQRQTPTLPGEGSLGPHPALLWRRVDSPAAPARRVAGAADLDDPACDPATTYRPGPETTGPCYGPFISVEGVNQQSASSGFVQLGGISADGRRVLFTSSAGRRPFDVVAYRPATTYLADMRPGLPRKLGVTEAWSHPPNVDGRSEARGGRLAADGRHAVFASRDNRFDGLQGVGAFPTGQLLTDNAYAVDLDARTVERVTVGHDGRDHELGSGQAVNLDPLAVSADASAVAFSAPDGNLFVGDANGAADVLVARTARPAVGRGERELPAAPPAPAEIVRPVTPLPSRFVATLGSVVVSPRTGTASVRVSLPAAGRIAGTAVGTATRRVRRGGKPRTVRSRVTVGRQARTVKSARTVTLRITVGAKARRALNRAPRRLSVRLSLRFSPKDARPTTTTRSYRLKQSHVARAGQARRSSRGTR